MDHEILFAALDMKSPAVCVCAAVPVNYYVVSSSAGVTVLCVARVETCGGCKAMFWTRGLHCQPWRHYRRPRRLSSVSTLRVAHSRLVILLANQDFDDGQQAET